jgi:hypothetical protein
MNDYIDRMATAGNTPSARKQGLFPSVYLPKSIYEALPAAYVTVGALFVAGSLYIGIDHVMTVGYLAVGLSCILGGFSVHSIRRAERSK